VKLAGVESRFRLQEQRAGNMVSKDEWRATRLKHIRGLTAPSDQQRLLLDLADQPTLTAAEDRDLAALWTAEKSAEKHQLAQVKAAKIVTGRKDAASKARDHKMFQAAGLMGLAGLLDTKTGELSRKPAALLGALLGLAEVDDPRRWEAWESKGALMLAERAKNDHRKE
jgi:Conjugal transfer protein TraD